MEAPTVKEYAEQEGITIRAVNKAVAEGRIRKLSNGRLHEMDILEDRKARRARNATDGQQGIFTEIKAAHEKLKAQKTKLELERLQGKLIPVADADRVIASIIAEAKAALDSIPARLCHRLAGLEAQAIREILQAEIVRVEQALAHEDGQERCEE